MYNRIKTQDTGDPFYTRSPLKTILLLLAVSLAVKLPLLPLKWGIIAQDGFAYVSTAQHLSQMGLRAALSVDAALPFYPMLIAFFHATGSGWAASGIIVSFLCGWLAVIPLYLLAARIFDSKTALVSSFFFILSPNVNFASTVIGNDATFMLLFTLGIWVLWLAYEKGGLLSWGGFIVLAVLATLTRSAGVALFPLLFFWVAHSYRHDLKGLSRLLVVTLLCLAAAAALLAVYSLYIGKLPGKIQPMLNVLTDISYLKAEGITADLKLAEQTTYMGRYFDFFEMARHYLHIIYMMGIVDLLIRACGYAIFPFVAIGLFWRKKGWGGYGRTYLLTIVLLFIVMNYVFVLKHNFTDARYLLPAAIALYPIGGQGYIRLEVYLKERFSISSVVIAVIVALLVVAGSGYKFNSRRKDALTYRNLQDSISWVKANTPTGAMMVTNYSAIPHSADRAYLELDCPGLDECMEASVLKESGADYIIYKTDNALAPSPYAPEKAFHGSRFDIYVFKAGGEAAGAR